MNLEIGKRYVLNEDIKNLIALKEGSDTTPIKAGTECTLVEFDKYGHVTLKFDNGQKTVTSDDMISEIENKLLEKIFFTENNIKAFSAVINRVKEKYEVTEINYVDSEFCPNPNCIKVIEGKNGIYIDMCYSDKNGAINLEFLGRGAALNPKEGNTSAFIDEEDNFILIDCGSTVFSKLVQADLLKNRKRITVLITHFHTDHIGSLGTLIEYCYYVLHTPVEVVTSIQVSKTLEEILNKMNVTNDMYEQVHMLETCPYEKEEDYSYYTVGSDYEAIKIAIFQQEHVDNMRCFGYFFIRGEERVFYSGDCCTINPMVIDTLSKHGEVYHDTCLSEFEGNPHTPLSLLEKEIDHVWKRHFHCMHFENSEAIKQAEKLGFQVVENNRY